jgi:hypothetical protein
LPSGIPADGFYEWQKTPEGKVPYSIEMKDGSPFVFAGLWDGWQNPHTKEWFILQTRPHRQASVEPNWILSGVSLILIAPQMPERSRMREIPI